MQVISLLDTKRLVKGYTYEVRSLYNSGSYINYNGILHLKNLSGQYSVKNFTDINGNPLPNIDLLI